MFTRKILPLIMILLFSVTAYSQTDHFNAENAYNTIHHLSVTIGPRPMGSASEHEALQWTVNKFKSYGTNDAYLMPFYKGESRGNSVMTNSGNAVGIFKGETDSTIVIGGHIDSDGREIPGANDNASGTACVIELARIWSKRPRHYTMIFIAFGGEEQGLFGSKHFVNHYEKINSVILMFSLDMAGSGDHAEVCFEMKANNQAPKWLVKDAFAIDQSLEINLLKYHTHYSTVNNSRKRGSGSDHMPFLSKNIPAIDFTVGTNESPIHTPQDKIDFISKPMLSNYGKIVDTLLAKYQEQGIPNQSGSKFMLWSPFGIHIYIPFPMILVINFLSILTGIWAFLFSRKHRLQIEKNKRIRFSGFKIFLFVVIIAIFAHFGEDIIQLLKSMRNPGVLHVKEFMWLAAASSFAGFWIVLQLTRKWKFSPDPYVYTKRALLVPFILLLLFSLANMRLALYPAMTLLFVSLTILIPNLSVKLIFTLITILPISKLLFHEEFIYMARTMARYSYRIDSPLRVFIFFLMLTLPLIVWLLPTFNLCAYQIARTDKLKNVLKYFRKPLSGLIILIFIAGYAGYLYSLPAYNEVWKPIIHVNAKYDMNTKESKLELKGSEYFHDVKIISDSLTKTYDERIHQDELPLSITADWIKISGDETLVKGERDTISVNWILDSFKPWHYVNLSVQADTSEIYDIESDQIFSYNRKKIKFNWFSDPPEQLKIKARFAIERGANIIRKITADYPEMPIPIEVTSDLASIRYRTVVTQIDTLTLN